MKNIESFPLVQKALSDKLGTTNDINDVPLIDEYKLSIKSMDDKRNPNAINIVATIKNNAGDIISMENDHMFKNDEEFQKYFDVTKKMLADRALKEFPQGLKWAADNIEHCGKTGILPEELKTTEVFSVDHEKRDDVERNRSF